MASRGAFAMLRNIVEHWMFLLDGATLTVVLLHVAQKLTAPEWRRIRGLLQKLDSHLAGLVGIRPLGIINGCRRCLRRSSWQRWPVFMLMLGTVSSSKVVDGCALIFGVSLSVGTGGCLGIGFCLGLSLRGRSAGFLSSLVSESWS